jgi:hypothetical protein
MLNFKQQAAAEAACNVVYEEETASVRHQKHVAKMAKRAELDCWL